MLVQTIHHVRCVSCRSGFDVPQAKCCCPHCGFSGLPMFPEEDAKLIINWQELRILAIWAEQYADDHKDELPGLSDLLLSIVGPLQQQYPSFRPLILDRNPKPVIN